MNDNLVHLSNPESLQHEWSVREVEFYHFSQVVAGHIDKYTVTQYGDAPADEVESWTPEHCILAIQKYIRRFGVIQRGRVESLRDIVKIAHFAAIVFYKMKPTTEEIKKIREGKV